MTAPNPDDGGEKPSSDNLTFEQLVAQRANPEPETVPTEEPALETQPEAEEQPEVEQGEPLEDEILGEGEEETETVDLLNLSPEEFQQLAKKNNSRLMARLGQLAAENKSLKEKQEEKPVNPLEATAPKPIVDNPFSNLATVEEVQEQYETMKQAAEETERLLDEYEDYRSDDIIEVGDKEMTKAQLKKANRNARKAMTELLPARFEELQKVEAWKAQEEHFKTQLRQEIPEFADENTELSKALNQLVSDPLVQKIKETVPELAPNLERILGHAARSMFQLGSKQTPATKNAPARPTPPSSPNGTAGARTRAQGNSKAITQSIEAFEKSGSSDSWQAARALQLANR